MLIYYHWLSLKTKKNFIALAGIPQSADLFFYFKQTEEQI